ncbi:putative TonB-dependent receptor [Flavihumibacter petaseus NBRC 106054]|uniref:Putative TonB-dependent receptor n=2 Tax=Flavihumibacter TaxID=1004301 RepID=A0A0E9N4L0_9BACT|nr:putative TonB-dependent receptor [Flavihumibacter petaseus NBRC 106054]
MMILAGFLCISGILLAGTSSGQDLSRIKVNLDLKNVSLRTALKKIENATRLSFSYKTSDVAAFTSVSAPGEETSVDKLLTLLLENTGLQYELVNTNIIIKKARPAESTASPSSLSGDFEGGIKGRVTNAAGEPLANASIILLGTSYGTAADAQGNFELKGVKAGKYRVQISAIGFGTEIRNVTITDNETASLSLQLFDDKTNMAEVTVTALGIQREKRSLGYSAQEVKGDLLAASHQPNVVNALQGQAAGLQINSGGGAPGQGAKIILRGLNSFDPARDFQPLFIIDGVPIDNSTDVGDGSELKAMGNRASDINPDDIETINILKGGAATALYGLRASTGAIIITTKSGKSGKLRGSFTSTGSVDKINKYPSTQKTYTQGWFNEYDSTSFWPAYGSTVAAAKAIDPNHPDELFNNYEHGYETGYSLRNSLNISGGTEKTIFNASISQFNQKGIMPFTDYKNYSIKVGGEFRLSNKVKFGTSLNYIKSGGRRGDSDRYNENLTYYAPRYDVWDYQKPDGTQKTIVGSDNSNPIYLLWAKDYQDNVDRLISNSYITYSPAKWLDINYRFGLDFYNDSRRQTTPGPLGVPDEIYPADDLYYGSVMEYNAKNTVLNSTLMLNFKNEIGSHIKSSLKIGHDVYSTNRDAVYVEGDTLEVPTYYNLNNAKRVIGYNKTKEYRIVGLFADWTLGYDNFLFLTLTGRNDWTSTLSKDNRSFFYPSASLSWVFSENFSLPDWWTYAKARVSVAKVGKDAPPYATVTGYVPLETPLSNGTKRFELFDQSGDANLRPEFTTSYEGGFELRFLRSRLGLDFTYYNNTSKDLIVPVKVPVTSGFDQIYLNSGSIRNQGVEISLSGTPVQTKDFSWDVRVNYTSNNNKVLSIYPGLTEIPLYSQFGYLSSTVTQKFIPGYPAGALFGRTYQRYFGSDKEDEANLDAGRPLLIGENGFPVLNPASKQQYIANSQPKWIGSLSSTLRYKQFNLYFLFDTQQGVYRYNQLANFMGSFALQTGSLNRNDMVVFDGYKADGTKNTKEVWLGQGVGPDGENYGNGYYRNYYRGASETFIENASWFRLRTLSVGYTVPGDLVRKSHFLTGAGITVSANNLWLHTKYTGFDPESSSTSANNMADGFSGFTYPATRSFILSLNFNF